MPRGANGKWTPPHNYVQEYQQGQKKIIANYMDEQFTDLAESLESDSTTAAKANCLVRRNSTGQVIGNITGNAATATKLATARTIGGVSFDGTANINLPGVNVAGNQNTTGNAATATKLATARTIGGVSFDGTASINLPGVNTTGNQNTTGTASAWTTARVLTLTGDVTGSASIKGNAAVSLATSISASAGIPPKPINGTGTAVGVWRTFGPVFPTSGGTYTLPSSGTWAYVIIGCGNWANGVLTSPGSIAAGVAAGGTSLGGAVYSVGFCWRIA